MTFALLPMPSLLNIEPRIWFILHRTTAGKNTSDNGAVVVLNVVTTTIEKCIYINLVHNYFLQWKFDKKKGKRVNNICKY